MGTSAYEQYLAERSDPESAYAKYLAEKPQPKKPMSSGELDRLRRVTALLNKVEFANASEGEPTYLDRIGMMAERGASAMGPLGRAIPTAVNYVVNKLSSNPITWEEASATNAQDIATAGENAPGVNVPLLGRMTLADIPAGAFAFGKYMKAMPGLTLPQTGAVFAGGSRATAPEDESAWGRAVGTAGHAIAGAVIPKVVGGLLEVPRMGSAWWRSAGAPAVDRNIVGRDIEMNAVGGPLYKMFTDIGNLPRTKKLDGVLGSELVQETLARIRKNDPSLARVPDTNAQLLHQLYREIGNKAFNAQHGIDPTPLRASLASALDDAAVAMGESYAAPLAVWRRGNQGIEAVIRGAKTLRNAAKGKTTSKKVLEESPAALERDFGRGTPLGLERTAAAEGILGELRSGPKVRMKFGVIPIPTPALRVAPNLLNIAEGGGLSPTGTLASVLRGSSQPPMGGTVASSVPRNPPAPRPAPKMLPAGARPMPSGARVMIASPAPPLRPTIGLLRSGPLPAAEPIGLGPFEMGSGAPKLLPSTTTPDAAPRALLPPWAKWGRGKDTPSKAFVPGEGGAASGPPIPAKGRLSDEEVMRRVWLGLFGMMP